MNMAIPDMDMKEYVKADSMYMKAGYYAGQAQYYGTAGKIRADV